MPCTVDLHRKNQTYSTVLIPPARIQQSKDLTMDSVVELVLVIHLLGTNTSVLKTSCLFLFWNGLAAYRVLIVRLIIVLTNITYLVA